MWEFPEQRSKLRGFEVVSPEHCYEDTRELTKIPARGSQESAAYDFYAVHGGLIRPGESVVFHTNIKAYMQPDEVLLLFPRSSQGIKFDLMLANTTGVIDADYYNNPSNEGAISIVLRNLGEMGYEVKVGERIAQGMFVPYLVADNDRGKQLAKRQGGIGSTGR